jgi:hypothetical protein
MVAAGVKTLESKYTGITTTHKPTGRTRERELTVMAEEKESETPADVLQSYSISPVLTIQLLRCSTCRTDHQIRCHKKRRYFVHN